MRALFCELLIHSMSVFTLVDDYYKLLYGNQSI